MPPRVSLCLIVRDEESQLPACLHSAADLVDEIIVVDTGSADATKEVAAGLGARVFEFAWCDSFAAARNESLRHATGDWICWLDADEYLDADNRAHFRALRDRLDDEAAAYIMRQRSASQVPDGSPTLVEQCRLFRNHPEIRWSYRVHEQILPAVNRLGHEVRFTDIAIDHAGYVDPQRLQEKIQRNLRLLHLEEAEQPHDPFTLFNLAWAYLETGRPEQGIAYARRSLARSAPGDSIVRKLHVILARAHERLGQPREALAWCCAGRARCPDDAELLFQEAVLLLALDEPRRAELVLRTLLVLRPGEQFASVDAGLRGHKARHQLARALQAQGRADEAEDQWRAGLAERPGFVPAWEGLAELYLAQGRWEDLAEAVGRLPVDGPAAAPTLLLRARAHLARREHTQARRLLEEAVQRAPQDVGARLLLSRALLEEGTDPAAAERCLRELTSWAPGLAEPWRNLALLLKRQGRLAEAVEACQVGLHHCPQDTALWVKHGVYRVGLGDLAGAEAALLRGLELAPAGKEAVPARHWLALVYLRQGRDREAEAQWRALLAEQPHHASAWEGLAEVALKRQRWDLVAECADQREGLPGGDLEAAVLRARVHLGRREFADALRLLDGVSERYPQAVKPRLMRSRVLLEAGDDAAAEAALCAVLEVDAANHEARHNLEVLRRKHSPAAANGPAPRGTAFPGRPAHPDGLGRPSHGAAAARACLRIGLASFYPRPFRTQTPYEQPLGGSESALCFLAEALAARGQDVFLLTASGETGPSRGVACFPLSPAALRQLPDLDVLVVQNLAGQGQALREALGRGPRLLYWTGHGVEQPAVQALRDPAERAAYDGFVFVSDWQRRRYHSVFGLEPARTVVLRNGISPTFENLFAPGESIRAAKAQPPVLAYTSTPDRGLDLLLEAFPRLRAAVPGTTLEVYSGLGLYGFAQAEDQARFGALYERCRATAGVDYVGPVPQPELARRLRRAALLAYPNTVPETSCIAVLEALAAGCVVVTSAWGALPETGAGFARLVPVAGGQAAYLDRFVAEVLAALNTPDEQQQQLQRQVAHVGREGTWAGLARLWLEWLRTS
jgi:tetratricopeptide (TPR) repeat protein/glycosyltransferase involved in cell wall biosynthesis